MGPWYYNFKESDELRGVYVEGLRRVYVEYSGLPITVLKSPYFAHRLEYLYKCPLYCKGAGEGLEDYFKMLSSLDIKDVGSVDNEIGRIAENVYKEYFAKFPLSYLYGRISDGIRGAWGGLVTDEFTPRCSGGTFVEVSFPDICFDEWNYFNKGTFYRLVDKGKSYTSFKGLVSTYVPYRFLINSKRFEEKVFKVFWGVLNRNTKFKGVEPVLRRVVLENFARKVLESCSDFGELYGFTQNSILFQTKGLDDGKTLKEVETQLRSCVDTVNTSSLNVCVTCYTLYNIGAGYTGFRDGELVKLDVPKEIAHIVTETIQDPSYSPSEEDKVITMDFNGRSYLSKLLEVPEIEIPYSLREVVNTNERDV